MLETSGGATEDPLPADRQEVDVTEQQHHRISGRNYNICEESESRRRLSRTRHPLHSGDLEEDT